MSRRPSARASWRPTIVDGRVIFGALMGAICLEPGHLVGRHSLEQFARADRRAGRRGRRRRPAAARWSGRALTKTVAAIVLSPLTGFFLALLLVLIVSWLFVRAMPRAGGRHFRYLQFVSASLYSLGHGGNDAQKTMGIIAVLLFSQGMLGSEFYVPFWVVITCQAAMALGTLFGGWRIVHTMGSKITRLTPDAGLLRRDRRRDHAVRARPGSAFRSRPRTRSRVRSSASARRARCRRCAGMLRAISSSLGSLRCQPPG